MNFTIQNYKFKIFERFHHQPNDESVLSFELGRSKADAPVTVTDLVWLGLLAMLDSLMVHPSGLFHFRSSLILLAISLPLSTSLAVLYFFNATFSYFRSLFNFIFSSYEIIMIG
jgi:hypothetical protein